MQSLKSIEPPKKGNAHRKKTAVWDSNRPQKHRLTTTERPPTGKKS